MWALIKSNKIDHIIAHPKSMVLDDVRHPRAIFTVWSDAERKAVGIVPVTTSGSRLDSRFYTEKNEVFALAGDKNSVVRTIGEKAANKKLDDVDAVDEDNDPILDDHDNQVVTLGLKSQAKLQADKSAHGFIKGFGWLMQRKVSADKAIPSAVKTYIAAVRTAHDSIATAITACNTMTKFIAIHTDEYNDDGSLKTVRKVNDWPDDYEIKKYRR
jgi:hypothetical protein